MSKLCPTRTAPGLNAASLRARFPVFAHHPGLIYLDTAASAQKPEEVINGIAEFYRADYANIHRGAYGLSIRATDRYEQARETARRFLNAASSEEIVFLRGATEAINLLANRWGMGLEPGDEILLTGLDMQALASLPPRTKLVAATHVANVTGHVTPVAEIVG